ncbi:MAG TPA: protein kinase [Bryobacteraceae bacterium]|nr:protein kinase [Bryobacteraceae bacterium]
MEDVFHSASERSPEARQSFLDDACEGDADLRLQVEFLLSEEERAGSFLEVPVMAALFPLERVREFGAYRILSPLGAGGMGEVYQAYDNKLGRTVAIKILPCEFARDRERLARFRREARTLASLNHPNIAAIYELVEESGEADYLVLEFVDGETLRGPLPVEIALDYARQIADALEAAHNKGIIHRDLKPANVKVTPHGQVKVLDFGLAKAIWGLDADRDLTEVGAALSELSLAGRIAGTPGYMSPEQARGEEVNPRLDIWAFGCLLYELLTGNRAFAGEREPDWHALPAKTPAKVRDLIRQCLQKDASRRPQSITDVRRTIEQAQHGWNRWRGAAVVTASIALIAIGTSLWLQNHAAISDRSNWVQLTRLPDPVSQPALSPDGKKLAFVRSSSTYYALGQIYVKELPDGEPVQLTNDSLKKMSPAFSPDGTRIAYTAVDADFNWDTWIVPTQGGEAHRWRRNATGLTWSRPQQVLYSGRRPKGGLGIVVAREDKVTERTVYSPVHDRGMTQRSQASPDGRWVLLAELTGYGNWGRCRVAPMDGSSQGQQVGPPGADCTFGAWSTDGEWMYLTSKAGGLYHIWRQHFPKGQPEQFTSGLTEEEGLAIAPDGRSIVTAVGLQSSSIWIHDPRGDRQISLLEGNAAYPRFTPDGKKLCYRIVKAVPRLVGTNRDPGEVWVADLDSGRSVRLAPGFAPLDYAISFDSQQVVMEAPDSEGTPRIWLAPFDRRSPPRQIPGVQGRSAHFGPSGEIFFRYTDGSSSFLYRVRQDGTGLRKAIEQPINHLAGVSADGRWIQAWATVPGTRDSAVQMFSLDGGSPILIGSNTALQWSSDGASLWISGGAIADDRTYIVPLQQGKILPPMPRVGFRSEQEIASLPGARRIDATGTPGPSSDVYALQYRTVQRNLYRIPIP